MNSPPPFSLLSQGDDTMTGDGGEYLRAEDLRELGDDSLPGQYLDGMNYLRFSLEGGRTDRYIQLCHMFNLADEQLEQSD